MKRRSFDQSDHIRLNLQWLERHEYSQTSIAHRVVAEIPTLPLSIAMIASIAIASHLSLASVCVGLLICLLLAFVLMLLAFFKISNQTKLFLTFISAVFLFVCLGATRLATIQYCPPRHISRLLKEERQLATLRGRIASSIQSSDLKQRFSSIPWLNSQSSFYLSATAIKTRTGWQNASGRIRVQVNERLEDIGPGNEIQIYCWLSRFLPPPNPGQFDLQKHMHNRGVFVAASVPIREGIEVIDRNNHSILFQLRSWLYRFSADALLDETATDPDVQSLVSALLLGRRGSLDPVIVSAFQKTNLAHFISLSGMHVGILAGSLWILLRTAQIPKRPRAVLCILLILSYAFVVPPRAPTMRAVFLSCFFFASAILYRRVNPFNTLALSAMVLLFFRPYELFTAGWQLSFLSVFGILLFYKTVQYYLLDRLFYPFVLLLKKRFILFQHFLYGVIELLAVGISAWIVIAPVLLYYFGQVNPLSPLWTVLVFPAVLLILYAGFLKIILSALLPTLASMLGASLNLLAHILEKMVMVLAKVDFLQIVSHRPGAAYIIIIYLLLAAAFLIPFRYRRTRKIFLLLLVTCFLFPWLSRISSLKNNNTLEMTCLCVGHGQAIVLSTPDGENILFDAGSITHQDIARKTVLPFLQHRRIFTLDTIAISHGDLDHLNAIPDIAAMVKTHHIYGNCALLENTQQPSLEKNFREQLEELGHELNPIQNQSYDDVYIRSLWPLKEFSNNLSENNRSQVFLIEYANRKILLCGDIEDDAQTKFLAHYPSLKIDVMVLPHHGSTTNLDTRFVEQLSPAIVIASCSRKNLSNAYKPHEGSDAQCFYTPIDGAVTVKIKADGTLRATGFLNSNK
ncbi:MAG: DNA internalization-related competence protein ComEC/Rec2 [Phycisphaerae bacterium]|nr:DNA internalization-related competence protein ComEC/Rec2 [Phycisphaerae bacterium]